MSAAGTESIFHPFWTYSLHVASLDSDIVLDKVSLSYLCRLARRKSLGLLFSRLLLPAQAEDALEAGTVSVLQELLRRFDTRIAIAAGGKCQHRKNGECQNPFSCQHVRLLHQSCPCLAQRMRRVTGSFVLYSCCRRRKEQALPPR